jgi:TPR repeat protein
MKRISSPFQEYIASVLLISLFLQSCGGGFNNNPIIPLHKEELISTPVNADRLQATVKSAPEGPNSLLNDYQQLAVQSTNLTIKADHQADKHITCDQDTAPVQHSDSKPVIKNGGLTAKQLYHSSAIKPNTTTLKMVNKQQWLGKQRIKTLLTNQVCTAQEGCQVRFKVKKEGALEAIVENRFPTGFTKQRLPVIIDGELSCTQAAVSNIAWQKQFIHLNDRCVYVGQVGLLGGGKDKDLAAEAEEEEEASEKEGFSAAINLPKESIKSLWQIGQAAGEEKYRDRALELLALEALNKGGTHTTHYLKKLNQLGTIPIIALNQAALPAAWQGKTPDELQAALHTLYLQALEAKERHLSTLVKAEQAPEQLAILELKYHFQKILEPTNSEKEGLIKDIQKGIDRLGILPISELVSLRRSYLSYLVREGLSMDIENNTAHIKKFIEKVEKLAQKGKSAVKYNPAEREALNAFSGKLYRQLGDLSKKLSRNSYEAVKSIEWQHSYYLKATKLKDAAAYYQLGLLYGDSNSSYYDMHEAKEALEASTRLGYVLAFYALSEHYEKEGDPELYLYWQEQAAKKGHPQALYKLSRASEQESSLSYLEQAGFSGNSQAQYELGNYYWDQGNYSTAIEWYNKSAYQGILASCAYLGLAARKGLGCTKDSQAALGYYLSAEKAGEDNAVARYGRARLYEKGEGVKVDLGTALSLYTQASELGHAKASYHAGRLQLHLSGQVEGCNTQAGYALLEKAGKAGVYQACLFLGKLYECGWSRLPDPTAALHWYSQASVLSPKANRISALAQLALMDKFEQSIEINKLKILSLLDQASLVEKDKHEQLKAALQNELAEKEEVYRNTEKDKEILKRQLIEKEEEKKLLLEVLNELAEKEEVYRNTEKDKETLKRQLIEREEEKELLLKALKDNAPNGANIEQALKNGNATIKIIGKSNLIFLWHHPLFKTNVHTLDLSDNQMGAQGAVVLAKHLKGTRVHTVDLSGNRIEAQGAEAFAKHLQGTNVHTIKLSANRIDNQGAIGFARALQGTNVHTIKLSSNRIDNQGAIRFARALQGTNVHTLDLACSGLGTAGAIEFPKALQGTQVHTLNLMLNQIGDAGVIALAKALQGTQVHTLNLESNEIGDAGAIELAKALTGTQVHKLSLFHNRIGDAGAIEFAKALIGTQVHTINLEAQVHPVDSNLSEIGAATQQLIKKQYPRIAWEF